MSTLLSAWRSKPTPRNARADGSRKRATSSSLSSFPPTAGFVKALTRFSAWNRSPHCKEGFARSGRKTGDFFHRVPGNSPFVFSFEVPSTGVAIGKRRSRVQRIICTVCQALKFELIEPLGPWFAQRLTDVARREAKMLEAKTLVPVP